MADRRKQTKAYAGPCLSLTLFIGHYGREPRLSARQYHGSMDWDVLSLSKASKLLML